MNQDLIIQELKAVLTNINEIWGNYLGKAPGNAGDIPDRICRASISRLRFCIATLEAKEHATVRLKPEHCCGAKGFGLGLDDVCDGCEEEK